MKKTILTSLFCICMMTLYAQSETSISSPPKKKSYIHYIGIEAGIRAFNGDDKQNDYIRRGPSSFSSYNSYYSNYADMVSTSFLSAIAEYHSPNDRLWISTGIKYSSLNTKLSSSRSDFFYVMLDQDQNNSYYYRVKEIREQNQYIGVPLDLSYSPFRARLCRLYFKIGFDFNFKIASKQTVDFVDAEMKKNEEKVLNLVDQPSPFYSIATLGVGLQFGRQNKPNFRIEVNFPSAVSSSKASGLVNPGLGGGGKVSFLIPLKNK